VRLVRVPSLFFAFFFRPIIGSFFSAIFQNEIELKNFLINISFGVVMSSFPLTPVTAVQQIKKTASEPFTNKPLPQKVMVEISKDATSNDKKTSLINPQTSQLKTQEVSDAVSAINESMKLASVGVHFEVDNDSAILVTKVVDKESGKVILQMPSEEAVRIAGSLGQTKGLLISQKI
jgi:uncharacterized FlaG/YvyC family protein